MDRVVPIQKTAPVSTSAGRLLKFASLIATLIAVSLIGARGANADCAALMNGQPLSSCVSPGGNAHQPVRLGSGKCAGKAYYVDQSFVGLGNITIDKDA